MKLLGQALHVLAMLARGLWDTFFKLLSALLLVWLVLSHTVTWAADLTAAILRTAFATTTIAAQARADLSDTQSRTARIQNDFDAERVRTIRLQAELDAHSQRISALDADLASQRARSDYYQDRFETVNLQATEQRNRISALQADLNTSRTRVQQLEAVDQSRVLFRGERVPIGQAVGETVDAVSSRTHRTALTNLGSMLGESIPFYGVGIIVAATSIEIGAACQNMKDLYELQVSIEPDSAIPEHRDVVCGLQVPNKEELWQEVRESPQEAWELSISMLNQTRGSMAWVKEIELPDIDLPDVSAGLDRATEAFLSTRGSLAWIKEIDLNPLPDDGLGLNDWLRSLID